LAELAASETNGGLRKGWCVMTIRNTSRRLAVAAALCAIGLSGLPAAGQGRAARGGTLVSAAENSITISSEGKIVLLKFKAEQNVVTVTGKLTPGQLRAGMTVRFTGTLKGSTLDGDISDVKVYTAADGYQLGVLQDAPDQPATITATVQGLKNGTLTVNAGRKKITGKLAEGAAIALETRDYSIAQRGNAVQYEGRAAPNDPTTINAKKIIITIGDASAGESDDKEAAAKKAKKKKS
jgi:hypothetical protein